MYKIFLLIILIQLSSCSPPTVSRKSSQSNIDSAKYKWTQLTDQAAFPKSYNFQMFSIRDTLWVMHHEGTWFSVDGQEWLQSPLTNILKDNAFLDYVWFKNALYHLGTFEGNSEQFKLTSSIFRTIDMKTWDTVAVESNLPRRFFYHPFVFKDKLWIIGGTDGRATFSDIWNSTDGIKWVKQVENAPFGKRDQSQFVLFNDQIFMLNNDVWVSGDGINWKKVTELSNDNLFGYAPVVFDNKIWLIGCSRNGVFKSQVLVSTDGKTWKTQSAPWTPRGAAAVTLFKGKVFMTGGKYGGFAQDGTTTEFVYSNDVWMLAKAGND
jgi:hypothetical protein